jgi:hypothetical protein
VSYTPGSSTFYFPPNLVLLEAQHEREGSCSGGKRANDRSARGDSKGFKAEKKDVSGGEALFPDNPARRVTAGTKKANANSVKKANESDVSYSVEAYRVAD